jgi:6-phosphogluconolactonase
MLEVDVLPDPGAAALRAAEIIAAEARMAVDARGRFLLAVSGGRTPWVMLRALAELDVPWPAVHVFQVDERVAPDGHPDRNLTQLREALVGRVPLAPDHLHGMPVDLPELAAAAAAYTLRLQALAGQPPVLDLVHLGLGPDGHTASLVPGDSALDVQDAEVTGTGLYQGRHRLTLTYPALDRARRILWLVTGADKARMLARLRRADVSIPAGRVAQANASVFADREAASGSDVS